MKTNFTEKYAEFYDDAISFWGEDAQLRMCIEEMSELTKELCKYFRLANAREKTPELVAQLEENRKHVIEETADVYNMIDQVARIFGENEVEEMREKKISRTTQRLEEYSVRYGFREKKDAEKPIKEQEGNCFSQKEKTRNQD